MSKRMGIIICVAGLVACALVLAVEVTTAGSRESARSLAAAAEHLLTAAHSNNLAEIRREVSDAQTDLPKQELEFRLQLDVLSAELQSEVYQEDALALSKLKLQTMMPLHQRLNEKAVGTFVSISSLMLAAVMGPLAVTLAIGLSGVIVRLMNRLWPQPQEGGTRPRTPFGG